MKKLSFMGLALLASAAATPAWSNILTFDGDICGPAGDGVCLNFSLIGQNYGDVAGVVDVVYDRDVGSGSGEDSLSFWDSAYSGLTSVAWGAANDAAGRAEIFLNPLGGAGITLLGFDIGSYPNVNRDTQLSIYSGAGNLLYATPQFTVLGNTPSSFTFSLFSQDGIRIQWGPSAYNVGIDNVSFVAGGAPVPEPETYALMATGFAMTGLMARRRRSPA